MLDGLRRLDDPGFDVERLVLGESITPTRPRRWHSPREVRTAAGLALLMIGGALLVAHVAVGLLLDETLLAALGIVP